MRLSRGGAPSSSSWLLMLLLLARPSAMRARCWCPGPGLAKKLTTTTSGNARAPRTLCVVASPHHHRKRKFARRAHFAISILFLTIEVRRRRRRRRRSKFDDGDDDDVRPIQINSKRRTRGRSPLQFAGRRARAFFFLSSRPARLRSFARVAQVHNHTFCSSLARTVANYSDHFNDEFICCHQDQATIVYVFSRSLHDAIRLPRHSGVELTCLFPTTTTKMMMMMMHVGDKQINSTPTPLVRRSRSPPRGNDAQA